MRAILALVVLGMLVPASWATGPDRGLVGEAVKPQKRCQTVYTIAAAPRRPRLMNLILNPAGTLARWSYEWYIEKIWLHQWVEVP